MQESLGLNAESFEGEREHGRLASKQDVFKCVRKAANYFRQVESIVLVDHKIIFLNYKSKSYCEFFFNQLKTTINI